MTSQLVAANAELWKEAFDANGFVLSATDLLERQNRFALRHKQHTPPVHTYEGTDAHTRNTQTSSNNRRWTHRKILI